MQSKPNQNKVKTEENPMFKIISASLLILMMSSCRTAPVVSSMPARLPEPSVSHEVLSSWLGRAHFLHFTAMLRPALSFMRPAVASGS